MSARAVIGIDPGVALSFARLDQDGALTHCFTAHKDEGPIDWIRYLSGLVSGPTVVVCENTYGRPGQDLSSTIKLVRPRFVMEGAARALRLGFIGVAPNVWKKHFNLPGGAQNKHKSVKAATAYWPDKAERFLGKNGHDKSEAALIAMWYCQVKMMETE